MSAESFEYRVTDDDRVLVYRAGRLVVTVGRTEARRLIPRLGMDAALDQRLLAAATGNYRRGNERRGS